VPRQAPSGGGAEPTILWIHRRTHSHLLLETYHP
jgi:hypothetical protein